MIEQLFVEIYSQRNHEDYSIYYGLAPNSENHRHLVLKNERRLPKRILKLHLSYKTPLNLYLNKK